MPSVTALRERPDASIAATDRIGDVLSTPWDAMSTGPRGLGTPVSTPA